MSHINTVTQKNTDFINLYNRSYRLAAAVFTISNIIDQREELGLRIKKLSLELISVSVSLKDINFLDAKKMIGEVEKNSLLLMSLLDIASVAGLISTMNGSIIKEEFQSFILEVGKFSEKFEDNQNVSVKSIFLESEDFKKLEKAPDFNSNHIYPNDQRNGRENGEKKANGHKRKDLRKNTILDFIKGHNNISIKDIIPNVVGCSEKTIQRELIGLIEQGKIKKMGERRWSRYSII